MRLHCRRLKSYASTNKRAVAKVAHAKAPDSPKPRTSSRTNASVMYTNAVAGISAIARMMRDTVRDMHPVYAPYRTLKYRAWRWWVINAVVDCSGSSWNSSVSETPMRSGLSSGQSLS